MNTPAIIDLVIRKLCTGRLKSKAQIGVVAFKIAAVLLGTVCSPQAKKVKGIALLNRATSSSQGRRRRGGRENFPEISTVQRSTAPNPVRSKATHSGGNTPPAILISRKEIPQIAESKNRRNKKRNFIEAQCQL